MVGVIDLVINWLLQGSRNNGTPLPAQMYYLKLYLDLMEGEYTTSTGFYNTSVSESGSSMYFGNNGKAAVSHWNTAVTIVCWNVAACADLLGLYGAAVIMVLRESSKNQQTRELTSAQNT